MDHASGASKGSGTSWPSVNFVHGEIRATWASERKGLVFVGGRSRVLSTVHAPAPRFFSGRFTRKQAESTSSKACAAAVGSSTFQVEVQVRKPCGLEYLSSSGAIHPFWPSKILRPVCQSARLDCSRLPTFLALIRVDMGLWDRL